MRGFFYCKRIGGLKLFRDPLHRLRLNFISRSFSRIGAATSCQPADGSQFHVVIAENLATKAQVGRRNQAAGGENSLLGFGHLGWFTTDEFHAAGRAAGIAAAGV